MQALPTHLKQVIHTLCPKHQAVVLIYLRGVATHKGSRAYTVLPSRGNNNIVVELAIVPTVIHLEARGIVKKVVVGVIPRASII